MYATQTVSNISIVLQDLVTFVVANGWTVNTDAVEGAGRRVSISKIANMYIHLRSFFKETNIVSGMYTQQDVGIILVSSRTNLPASVNANSVYVPGALPINPATPITYHFFSTPDGNAINIALVTTLVSNVATELVVFSGFGTSINKTTTLNEGWYMYAHGMYSSNNAAASAINASGNPHCIAGPRQSLLNCNVSISYNYPAINIYSTSSYYSTRGIPNLYSSETPDGSYGILPLTNASTYGVGSYSYLTANTASTAFANTTLVPSNIFLKHPTIGYELVGTFPALWFHSAVPLLYKNGQTVMVQGKEYCLFQYQAFEVNR